MIDYEILCQSIVDWRNGKKPEAPPLLSGGQASVTTEPEYEEYSLDEQAPGSGYAAAGYEELSPEHQVEQTLDEVTPGSFGELDSTVQDGHGSAQLAGADHTHAYVPEEYDPANVAGREYELAPEAVTPTETAEVDVEEIEAVGSADEIDVSEEQDDYERDYELEEIDDFASFNPYTGLADFFKAENHITAVWEDDDQRRDVLAQYGIRNEQHFYQVTSSMERYFVSEDAEARYGGLDGIMQLKMNASQDAVREQQQERMEGELASEFEPVEGISLQQWAAAQAQVASGVDAATASAGLGIDEDAWQRVSAEWNDRMARDTTMTIATEYGKAFSGAGAGAYGEAGQAAAAGMDAGGDPVGDPPISIEQWVEIEVAQSVGHEQGTEAADVLAQFSMTPLDWSNASAWWSQYFSRHAMENDGALHQHYTQLREYYEAHYRGQGEEA